MKRLTTALAAATVAMAGGLGVAQAATVDIIDAPTGFFVPTDGQKNNSPYYRWHDEDWGWTHNAIAAGFTTAKLLISAFDVDLGSGEVDNIYAFDNGVKTLLGSLDGNNNVWAFTEFNLGANFFDDIQAGLQVFIDIDSTHSSRTWAVTLAKSVITTDGGTPPNPDPDPVPLPAAGWLMLAGLGGIAGLRRRRKSA
ncbi:MAG: VPLPA-CTERM sorting domain-containing protein [Rhodobacteraceae bacterium]|nr:VPLPA-CTERM sorting domain-containing protein [Paracoccaceae bacterium]